MQTLIISFTKHFYKFLFSYSAKMSHSNISLAQYATSVFNMPLKASLTVFLHSHHNISYAGFFFFPI